MTPENIGCRFTFGKDIHAHAKHPKILTTLPRIDTVPSVGCESLINSAIKSNRAIDTSTPDIPLKINHKTVDALLFLRQELLEVLFFINYTPISYV